MTTEKSHKTNATTEKEQFFGGSINFDHQESLRIPNWRVASQYFLEQIRETIPFLCTLHPIRSPVAYLTLQSPLSAWKPLLELACTQRGYWGIFKTSTPLF